MFLTKILTNAQVKADYGLEFIIEAFSYASATTMKHRLMHLPIFLDFSEHVVMHQPPDVADRFFQIVFPQRDDLQHFKKEILHREDVKLYFGYHLLSFDVGKLKKKLTCYLNDSDSVAEYVTLVFLLYGGLTNLREYCEYYISGATKNDEQAQCQFLLDVLSGGTVQLKKRGILSANGKGLARELLKKDYIKQFTTC